MKIESLDVFTYDVPVTEPLQFGGELEVSVPGVLLKMSTNEGIEGAGETTLYPGFYHGETQKSVLGCIDYLRPEMLHRDLFNIQVIEQVANKIAANLIPKTILSFALFDIIGKKLNAPVYRLLGGQVRDRVPLVGMVGGGRAQESVDRSMRLIADGFSTLKLTRGLDPSEEIDRVKAIRAAAGSQVKIRFDVNTAWTPKFAIRTIRKMERYEIEFVEQPVPAWDIGGLAKVAKHVETPISADESLVSVNDAVELVRKEAVDIFNIKVEQKGGLFTAGKMASIAEAADISYFIGGGPSLSFGTAAALHFAVSREMGEFACEFIGPYFFKADVAEEPLVVERGTIDISEKPGLGVTLDEKSLNGLVKGSFGGG